MESLVGRIQHDRAGGTLLIDGVTTVPAAFVVSIAVAPGGHAFAGGGANVSRVGVLAVVVGVTQPCDRAVRFSCRRSVIATGDVGIVQVYGCGIRSVLYRVACRQCLYLTRLEFRCEAALVGSAGFLGGIVARNPALIRVWICAVVVVLLVSCFGLLLSCEDSCAAVRVVSTCTIQALGPGVGPEPQTGGNGKSNRDYLVGEAASSPHLS
jgi:hypothetical protein